MCWLGEEGSRLDKFDTPDLSLLLCYLLQPVGKAFAMVANKSTNSHSLASECIKSNDGHEEIIKVRDGCAPQPVGMNFLGDLHEANLTA